MKLDPESEPFDQKVRDYCWAKAISEVSSEEEAEAMRRSENGDPRLLEEVLNRLRSRAKELIREIENSN